MKIENTFILQDGQRIYIMGDISPQELDYYWSQVSSDARVFEWTTDQQSHYAIRKAIRKKHPELYQWLKNNDAVTTNWVDPEVFRDIDDRHFKWGVGFRDGDPMETVFAMRWS